MSGEKLLTLERSPSGIQLGHLGTIFLLMGSFLRVGAPNRRNVNSRLFPVVSIHCPHSQLPLCRPVLLGSASQTHLKGQGMGLLIREADGIAS